MKQQQEHGSKPRSTRHGKKTCFFQNITTAVAPPREAREVHLRRPYKRHETHLPHKGKKQKLIISPRRRRHRPVPRRQEPFLSSRRRPNPTLNPNLKRTLNPPSSSRDEKETTMFLATRHQLQHFLRRRDFRRNKTLTCALVAEQSRTSPASSGSIAALDRMAEASKKGSKGRERRKKKEDDESVVAVQPLLAVQLSLSNTFSAPFLFPLPLSRAHARAQFSPQITRF